MITIVHLSLRLRCTKNRYCLGFYQNCQHPWWGIFFRNGCRVHRYILCQTLRCSIGFVAPSHLRQCIALFAVIEGWLLLDIEWFVSFFPTGADQNHCIIDHFYRSPDVTRTNHQISSNSHPLATAYKAIHCLKREGGGLQNQRDHHIISTKYEAMKRMKYNSSSGRHIIIWRLSLNYHCGGIWIKIIKWPASDNILMSCHFWWPQEK